MKFTIHEKRKNGMFSASYGKEINTIGQLVNYCEALMQGDICELKIFNTEKNLSISEVIVNAIILKTESLNNSNGDEGTENSIVHQIESLSAAHKNLI